MVVDIQYLRIGLSRRLAVLFPPETETTLSVPGVWILLRLLSRQAGRNSNATMTTDEL